MQRDSYQIQIEYVTDDAVWIAYSDDISGLTLQTNTLPELISEIEQHAPMLLKENHGLKLNSTDALQIRLNSFEMPVAVA